VSFFNFRLRPGATGSCRIHAERQVYDTVNIVIEKPARRAALSNGAHAQQHAALP
jgi:hypothetical protein